jgi:hypothetical protein
VIPGVPGYSAEGESLGAKSVTVGLIESDQGEEKSTGAKAQIFVDR